MSNYEIKRLIDKAKELKLDGIDKLDKYTLDEIADIYNGIGAGWMPEVVRRGISALHVSLLPVALIHDVEFFEGGDRDDFKKSNDRFYANGLIVARSYGWYNPRRYLVAMSAWRFYRILSRFGCFAFGA